MNIIKALVIGIVEGITEWMPVSSTAHIKIFNQFLLMDVSKEFFDVFEVVIQFGAIVALIIVFWKSIWPFGESNNPLGNGILSYVKKDKIILWLKIAVACIPVILYKLLLDDYVTFINESNEMIFISIALILVGLIFVFVEFSIKNKRPSIATVKDITFTNAIVIGLVQLIAAVFPGVSRSGAIIIASLLMGISRTAATKFTFDLAIPVMLGASFMEIIKFEGTFTFVEILTLLAGCASAFFVSLFVINFVINYIRKNNFIPFGIYRVLLGIVIIIFLV